LQDFLRGGNALARLHHRGLVLLADDVHAQFDAFVADEHRRSGDQLAHLMLALAAERAIERVLGITAAVADLAHRPLSFAHPACELRKPDGITHARPLTQTRKSPERQFLYGANVTLAQAKLQH
jgi:hypothetical protein